MYLKLYDDELTLLLARRRFSATVPLTRPREGDLVYIPLVKNFFEISFLFAMHLQICLFFIYFSG